MFLKLFPRYAGRARRGATVVGDHLRGTAVVVENAPKSLSRHDGASVIRACRQRCEELVAETLVVPFCVIVHYVFGYRCAQVSLTERYEAVETLSTYGENESFRVVGVLITEDSSFHWPTKRIHVYSETSRRAGFEFVCVFGHDGNEKKPGPRERPGLSGSM